MYKGELFNNVKKIILKKAPNNLIAGGAPDDEYDVEIMQIIGTIKESENSDDLSKKIADIFNKSFSLNDHPQVYKEQAEEIFKLKS